MVVLDAAVEQDVQGVTRRELAVSIGVREVVPNAAAARAGRRRGARRALTRRRRRVCHEVAVGADFPRARARRARPDHDSDHLIEQPSIRADGVGEGRSHRRDLSAARRARQLPRRLVLCAGPEHIARLEPLGTVLTERMEPQGWHSESLTVFNAWLKPGVQPVNQDGEVMQFDRVDWSDILHDWRQHRWTMDAACVMALAGQS